MAKRNEYSIPRITTWLLLNQMSISMGKYEESEFTKNGLTIPQFFIIAAIKYLKPPVTPTDLSQHLDRNLNTITLTLDRMEKAGLVKKRRDLPDRRTLRVSLTPKSKKIFSKCAIPYANIANDTMSCLSDEELRAYAALTNKLRERLFEKLGIKELSSHRIETMNYILRGENKSIETINLESLQPKDIP